MISRSNVPQFDGPDGEEADQSDNPPNEGDDTLERMSYWSDDDGSSSDEHESEGEGNKMVIDSEDESETEEIENQHVMYLEDLGTFATQETFRPNVPELTPQPQLTPFSLPAVEDTPMSPPMMIGQQGPALQADTMQIPLGCSQVHLTDSETNVCTPEDNSTG